MIIILKNYYFFFLLIFKRILFDDFCCFLEPVFFFNFFLLPCGGRESKAIEWEILFRMFSSIRGGVGVGKRIEIEGYFLQVSRKERKKKNEDFSRRFSCVRRRLRNAHNILIIRVGSCSYINVLVYVCVYVYMCKCSPMVSLNRIAFRKV